MGGRNWTEEENRTIRESLEQGMGTQQIYASGKLPGRTYEAVRRQVNMQARIVAKISSEVEPVEPATDALTIDKIVKLYSTAYDQICRTQRVDKLALERLRIIFQAAKDYAPLLAGYERWERIEKDIDALKAQVEQLQTSKNLPKA